MMFQQKYITALLFSSMTATATVAAFQLPPLSARNLVSERAATSFYLLQHASTFAVRRQHSRKNQQQKKQSNISRLSSSNDDDTSWNTPSKSAMIGGAGVNNAGEPPFEIRGFSLGNLVVGAGVLVTIASFTEYLSGNSDSLSVSGLGFVYGLPIFLAGAALKYAEIEPVPVFSSKGGEDIFDSKATETIKKIKQDVTRHRYGDEAHLDTTVKKLGLVVAGKAYPQLRELRQDVTPDGKELIFTIVWQSVDTPYKMWADDRRIQKYESFFGPGVTAEVVKIDAEQRIVGIQLTTNTSSKPSTTATSESEKVITA